MLLYANKVETNEKEKLTEIKKLTTTYTFISPFIFLFKVTPRVTHARERRRVAIYEGAMTRWLAGAGMKTEQISREKAGFMQSRATTIQFAQASTRHKVWTKLFCNSTGSGFQKSFKLIIG